MLALETKSVAPVHFDVIEVLNEWQIFSLYIGNTGGKYTWYPTWNYFGQHFTPDNYQTMPVDEELRRKFVTLYPAIVWHFLEWLRSLPDMDPKRGINLVKGYTNPMMSHFRAKLLGEAYVARYVPAELSPLEEAYYAYTLDLVRLQQNRSLSARLQRFNRRAEAQHYTTTFEPLKDLPDHTPVLTQAIIGS